MAHKDKPNSRGQRAKTNKKTQANKSKPKRKK